MNPNDESKLHRLEEFLAATEHQTKAEALEELASNGVDIDQFRTKVASLVRKGYQRQVRLDAEASAAKAKAAKATLFGDLTRKTKAELVAIRDQIINGVFGTVLQNTAVVRCRNHQGDEVSEEELRSWLEDISSSSSDK